MSWDNKEDPLEEGRNTLNDGFSSPEAGEIFSSDSESELMKDNLVSPAKDGKMFNWKINYLICIYSDFLKFEILHLFI